MQSGYRSTNAIIILALLVLPVLVPGVIATNDVAGIPAAGNTSSPVMEVGVFVNSINNLDLIAGTYSEDFYLHFRWTDPAIQTANFEIMNGQPCLCTDSQEKLSENKSGPVKEEWYRVRADFRITPDIRDYPFESEVTVIEIEDAEYNSSRLTYVPLTGESGIDPDFVIPGWTIGTPSFVVSEHEYPWNETHSLLSFSVPITKNPTDSLLQTLIPPLIFCLIAGLSFIINVREIELIHLRYVLTTSMFISAVMYQFTQVGLLPGLSILKLFDKFMIAVYLFLALSILVTTLVYLAQYQWERPDLVKPINRSGVVLSILVPIMAFWLLFTCM